MTRGHSSSTYYNQSAATGDSQAQHNLGHCYRGGMRGIGFEKNYEHAVEWFIKAALQGYAKAQLQHSALAWRCVCTRTRCRTECREGIRNLQPKCCQRSLSSTTQPWVLLPRRHRLQTELRSRVRVAREGCSSGDDDSQDSLAYAYAHGQGVPKNDEKAFELYNHQSAA